MAVAREKGDQAEKKGCENRDPALTVKLDDHRSQPKPWNHGSAPLWAVIRLGLAGGADDRFVLVVDEVGRRP
jgi:hypothetical protein